MSFDQIIGHRSAKRILVGAVEHHRVAGTYLFAGPEGIGKRLTATSLAALLNCVAPRREPPDACGECRSCRKIREGVHPDVISVRPEKTVLKIEQIRQVLEIMALQPYEAEHRVIIIEEADTMNEAAANAFLKTLEEPAAGSHIILVASRPSALLPTILSRCQTVTFQPLSMPEVRQVLVARGVEAGRIDLLTALSEGSPGRALSLAGDEAEKNRREALSILERTPWESTVDLIAYAETLGKEPVDVIQSVLNWLYSFLRDLAVFDATADKSLITNSDMWYDISQHCDRYRGRAALRGISLVRETLEGLRRNANRQLALEALFLRMSETGNA